MFFVFATICAAILDGVLGGSNGIATAQLTADMSATAVTANVDNASALSKTISSRLVGRGVETTIGGFHN